MALTEHLFRRALGGGLRLAAEVRGDLTGVGSRPVPVIRPARLVAVKRSLAATSSGGQLRRLGVLSHSRTPQVQDPFLQAWLTGKAPG